ncbi:MAG TPA: DUF3667 domain-containing protein [Chitinophagaceae bacterium]|nr:DUF3667 domain-containing protein [Chitinophagaceae bacterium]
MQADIQCRNCGNQFSGKYCNQCGEKVYTDHDKTFRHFAEEGFHFITHFDSKLLKTWWRVMTRPGVVSLDISNGIRKRHYKPLSLFIIGVIIYLLFPIFEGLNMPMAYHKNEMYGHFAEQMIEQKMAAKHLTEEQLGKKFADKSPKFAKILLLVIIPLSAFVLQGLFFRRKKFFFDHATLAAELNTFYLYFTFLIIPLGMVIFILIVKLLMWMQIIGNPGYMYLGDNISLPLYAVTLAIWCFVAFRRVYKEKWGWIILKTILFLIAHALIVYTIYRFILLSLVLLFI